MVTIKQRGYRKTEVQYLRVRNTTPQERSSLSEKLSSGWVYCPKGEWKKGVRDQPDASSKETTCPK